MPLFTRTRQHTGDNSYGRYIHLVCDSNQLYPREYGAGCEVTSRF
jgi:hypothetical protein